MFPGETNHQVEETAETRLLEQRQYRARCRNHLVNGLLSGHGSLFAVQEHLRAHRRWEGEHSSRRTNAEEQQQIGRQGGQQQGIFIVEVKVTARVAQEPEVRVQK